MNQTEKMIEALQTAKSIIDYCQGDAWERECTENERKTFATLYEELFPTPPQPLEPEKKLYKFEIKCECGIIVDKKNLKTHVDGKRHKKIMGTYIKPKKSLKIKLKTKG